MGRCREISRGGGDLERGGVDRPTERRGERRLQLEGEGAVGRGAVAQPARGVLVHSLQVLGRHAHLVRVRVRVGVRVRVRVGIRVRVRLGVRDRVRVGVRVRVRVRGRGRLS